MPPQFVFDITHFKLSNSIWKSASSGKIVGFLQGFYNKAVIKSHDGKVSIGSQYCLPFADTLKKVRINFLIIDGLLTQDIGSAEYLLSEDQSFLPDGSLIDIRLDINPKGGSVAIGRVTGKVSVQYLFDDEPINQSSRKRRKKGDLDMQLSIPGFRFKRLSKGLNWERIRGLNLNHTVQRNDVHTLMTCIEDVALGDVSREDVDPHLHKALQMAQYGAQYMLSCKRVMKDREKILKEALKTFDEEEELLDLKIAKLKARQKALIREARDLDTMTIEYTSALRELNPKLIHSLYKTYKEKLKPSHDEDEEDEEEELRIQDLDENDDDRRKSSYPSKYKSKYSDSDDSDNEKQRSHQKNKKKERKIIPNNKIIAGEKRLTVQPRSEASEWKTAKRNEQEHELEQRNLMMASKENHPTQQREYLPLPTEGTRGAKIIMDRGDVVASTAISKFRSAAEAVKDINNSISSTSQDDTEVVSIDNRGINSPRKTTLRSVAVKAFTRNRTSVDENTIDDEAAENNDTNLPPMGKSASTVTPEQSLDQFGVTENAPLIRSTARSSIQSGATSISADSLNAPSKHLSNTGTEETDTRIRTSNSLSNTHPPPGSRTYTAADFADPDDESDGGQSDQIIEQITVSRRSQDDKQLGIASRVVDDAISESLQELSDEQLPFIPSVVEEPVPRTIHSTAKYEDSIDVEDLDESLRAEPIERDSYIQPRTEPGLSDTKGHDPRETRRRLGHREPSFRDEDKSDSSSPDRNSPTPVHPVQSRDLLSAKSSHQLNKVTISTSKEGKVSEQHSSAIAATESMDSSSPRNILGTHDYDEDDPFGQSFNSQSHELARGRPQNLSVMSDIDTSQSMIIDLVLPSENQQAKDNTKNDTGTKLAKSASHQSFDDASEAIDTFDSPSEFQPLVSTRRRSADADDDVLFGTSKYSGTLQSKASSESGDLSFQTGTWNPSIEPQLKVEVDDSRSSFDAERPTTDEPPSYDTMLKSFPASAESQEPQSVKKPPLPTSASSQSSIGRHKMYFFEDEGVAVDSAGSVDNAEDYSVDATRYESSAPPTIETDVFSPSAASAATSVPTVVHDNSPVPTEVSDQPPATFDSEDGHSSEPPPAVVSEANSPIEVQIEESSNNKPPTSNLSDEGKNDDDLNWSMGRGPIEDIELGRTFDVFVSALGIFEELETTSIKLKVEFMGIESNASDPISVTNDGEIRPISFAAHMSFNEDKLQLLKEEISEYDDAIAFQIHIIDTESNESLGVANVEIWVMVEQAVNILRQEVQLLDMGMSFDIGVALVDVKGFQLLRKCGAMQRLKRHGLGH